MYAKPANSGENANEGEAPEVSSGKYDGFGGK